MAETGPDYEQPKGYEATISTAVDVSCKLPLLDGDVKLVSGPLVTEVELEQLERLLQILKQAEGSLEGIICTAWGLLLRCYTGQDHVCFQLIWDENFDLARKLGASEDDELAFRMDFQEQESLSTYLPRAMISHSLIRQGPCMASNTRMWMQDNSLSDKLRHNINSQMTTALEPSKVGSLPASSCG